MDFRKYCQILFITAIFQGQAIAAPPSVKSKSITIHANEQPIISISEKAVNLEIASNFPMEEDNIIFSNPSVLLTSPDPIFCATAVAQIPLLRKKVHFCTYVKIKWDSTRNQIIFSNPRLTKIDVSDFGFLQKEAKSFILRYMAANKASATYSVKTNLKSKIINAHIHDKHLVFTLATTSNDIIASR